MTLKIISRPYPDWNYGVPMKDRFDNFTNYKFSEIWEYMEKLELYADFLENFQSAEAIKDAEKDQADNKAWAEKEAEAYIKAFGKRKTAIVICENCNTELGFCDIPLTSFPVCNKCGHLNTSNSVHPIIFNNFPTSTQGGLPESPICGECDYRLSQHDVIVGVCPHCGMTLKS